MKKINTKAFKPAYTVDISATNDVNDLKLTVALTKHNAHLPLTDDDLIAILDYVIDLTLNTMPNFAFVIREEAKKPKKRSFWKRLFGRDK